MELGAVRDSWWPGLRWESIENRRSNQSLSMKVTGLSLSFPPSAEPSRETSAINELPDDQPSAPPGCADEPHNSFTSDYQWRGIKGKAVNPESLVLIVPARRSPLSFFTQGFLWMIVLKTNYMDPHNARLLINSANSAIISGSQNQSEEKSMFFDCKVERLHLFQNMEIIQHS